MNFYDEYKPFRNYMRKFSLLPGLLNIRQFYLNLLYNKPLPSDYFLKIPSHRRDLKGHIFPWELDILVRELILNSSTDSSLSLSNWSDLGKAVNMLRHLDDVAFDSNPTGSIDAMLELHRIAHRQIVWQIDDGAAPVIRAYKIYGYDEVNEIVIRKLGMDMQRLIRLGVAVSGVFHNRDYGSRDQDYSFLGINQDSSNEFFRRLLITTKDLKENLRHEQRYDQDWVYTWNPLVNTPLISYDKMFPERLICPVPWHLQRRITVGVFYDLVKEADFSNPYGNSFEQYIGEVLNKTCGNKRFSILDEEPYTIGCNKMHGIDWTLSDNTGHVFIEAKTKRLRLEAKTKLDTATLDEDLHIMATGIVQHYQNIHRAYQGFTRWQRDGLPTYAIVLTLEDWFFVSSVVPEMLRGHVVRLLSEEGIADDILITTPYSVISASEFEILSQVIGNIGIQSVMEKVTHENRKGLSALPFASKMFPDVISKVDPLLFRDEFDAMWSDLPNISKKFP